MEFHTLRLLLREFEIDDWQAVHAYRNDARYLRFYPQEGESEVETRAFIERLIEQQQSEPRLGYQMAITLPESGQLIGNVGIRQRGLTPHQPAAGQADIGYELDPRYWGNGYATEAGQAILHFGFDQLGLHRIWAQCLADNTASARVLEKLGMRLEGRLRENEHFKNRWWDALIYAMLDYEWQALPEITNNDRNAPKHSSNVQFRNALPGDAPRLTEIAFSAKRYWGYPERWIVLWREQLIITQDYINSHHVYLALMDGRITGFYSVGISNSNADLDHLWVDPPYVGQGIGRALVEHACQIAANLGAERLIIVADPNAEGFYRRLGAEKVGESIYQLEGQVRRLPRMEISLDKRAGA